MKHAKSYRPNYPRVMFSRNNFFLLNGAWDFKSLEKEEDIAFPQEKAFDFSDSKKIQVPYAPQCEDSEINEEIAHAPMAYQRKFTLPAVEDQDYLLHFEAVDYECYVFVNRRFAGHHVGGYTRFSMNIRPLIAAGENTIAVFVKDGSEADKPRGKQTWMKEPFGCWYKSTGGIWKTVWLEQVSPVRLNSVQTRFDYEKSLLLFEYDVRNFHAGLTMKIKVSFDEKTIQEVAFRLTREHGTIALDIRNEFEAFRIQMWSPDHPHIFDLEYTLSEKEETLDFVRSYTAYNHFEARKNIFYSNNNPVFLKMILFQGYYPRGGMTGNEEFYLDVIQKCKEIGLNGIRMHQKIEDELFYYYCDMLGLFVFFEMPSPYEYSLRTVDSLVNQTKEAILQFRNHPCIIAYVPINESWGVPTISYNEEEMNFARSLYYLCKSLDPDRLVIDNDGWEHTEATDILTLHNYDQNARTLSEFYLDFNRAVSDTNMLAEKQFRACFAKGCSYRGQPVMIDEFVGTTISGSAGWGYGEQSQNLESYFETVKNLVASVTSNRLIAGYCITQFNDTYAETNGLFDPDFQPKLTLGQLKDIIDEKK